MGGAAWIQGGACRAGGCWCCWGAHTRRAAYVGLTPAPPALALPTRRGGDGVVAVVDAVGADVDDDVEAALIRGWVLALPAEGVGRCPAAAVLDATDGVDPVIFGDASLRLIPPKRLASRKPAIGSRPMPPLPGRVRQAATAAVAGLKRETVASRASL